MLKENQIEDREAWNDYLYHSKREADNEDFFNRHQFISADGLWIYHVSIIDYLQMWDLNKKAEHFCKTYFLGKNKKNISAVEPSKYAKRFLNFVQRHVFNDHLKRRREKDATIVEKWN
jgi:hypothetical protein